MSHIPNSAMPHAGPDPEMQEEEARRSSLSERAGWAAEKARENPKTSIAAGAAMIVGAIAAAAVPFIRARNKANGKSAAAKKQTASAPTAGKSSAAPKAANSAGKSRAKKSGTGTSRTRTKK